MREGADAGDQEGSGAGVEWGHKNIIEDTKFWSQCLVFVQREFQRSFKGVFKIFQGSFRSVQRKLLECVKEVSMVFEGRLKDASMES